MKPHCLLAIIAVMALTVTQLGLPRLVGAQTRVEVKKQGRNITITVPIDAAGADKGTATFWKESAEAYWNDAFNDPSNPYKGCLKLHLKVEVKSVGYNAKQSPNRHMIFATANEESEDRAHGGITRGDPYTVAIDGYFDPVFADPTKGNHVAHEVGHLLGLPDEYTEVSKHPRKTSPLKGREGTLMADGGRIDPLLIKTLVRRIRKVTDKVRDCTEDWSGRIESKSEAHIAVLNCTESWELEFTVAVKEDGDVSGKGRGTALAANCSIPKYLEGQATRVEFDVVGTKHDDQFELRLGETAIDGTVVGLLNYTLLGGMDIDRTLILVVPITGPGKASGETTLSRSTGTGTATGVHAVTMVCDSCEPEAVTERSYDSTTGNVSTVRKSVQKSYLWTPPVLQGEG